MREDRLLFKVKMLEKLIFRTFIHNSDLEIEEKVVIPTPTQMQIIEYILDKSPNEVYQRDLENILNLRRATVSGVLQTMEKNGLIERITTSSDARVKKIILKTKAQRLFLEKEKKMEMIEEMIIQGIPPEELEIFSNVLDKMKSNIKKESEKIAKRRERI
ncbi:MAG: MarR family winged helix-turn-helix transcriptional regulator [bacterium]|nr:MarR family winged helix-turn-helix transcriptional regulator [bacterium]